LGMPISGFPRKAESPAPKKEIVFADVIKVSDGALELQQYDGQTAGAPLRRA